MSIASVVIVCAWENAHFEWEPTVNVTHLQAEQSEVVLKVTPQVFASLPPSIYRQGTEEDYQRFEQAIKAHMKARK